MYRRRRRHHRAYQMCAAYWLEVMSLFLAERQSFTKKWI